MSELVDRGITYTFARRYRPSEDNKIELVGDPLYITAAGSD